MIIRRTFDALQYPKSSPERARLNLDVATSEYKPKFPYIFFTERWGSQLAKSLREAEEMEVLHIRSTLDN